jgi:hypothetical protein
MFIMDDLNEKHTSITTIYDEYLIRNSLQYIFKMPSCMT